MTTGGLFANKTPHNQNIRRYRAVKAAAKAAAEWPQRDTDILCDMIADGYPFSAVATRLGKTKGAVTSRWLKIVRAMGVQAA